MERNYYHAAETLRDIAKSGKELTSEILQALIHLILDSKPIKIEEDEDTLFDVVPALDAMSQTALFFPSSLNPIEDYVVEKLDDKSPSIRLRAISILAAIATPKASLSLAAIKKLVMIAATKPYDEENNILVDKFLGTFDLSDHLEFISRSNAAINILTAILETPL